MSPETIKNVMEAIADLNKEIKRIGSSGKFSFISYGEKHHICFAETPLWWLGNYGEKLDDKDSSYIRESLIEKHEKLVNSMAFSYDPEFENLVNEPIEDDLHDLTEYLKSVHLGFSALVKHKNVLVAPDIYNRLYPFIKNGLFPCYNEIYFDKWDKLSPGQIFIPECYWTPLIAFQSKKYGNGVSFQRAVAHARRVMSYDKKPFEGGWSLPTSGWATLLNGFEKMGATVVCIGRKHISSKPIIIGMSYRIDITSGNHGVRVWSTGPGAIDSLINDFGLSGKQFGIIDWLEFIKMIKTDKDESLR
jgi:hypothetical protein